VIEAHPITTKSCVRCEDEFLGEAWRNACWDCYEYVVEGQEFFTERIISDDAPRHYENGFFLWEKEDKGYYWFSPDERCVLVPEKFHESKTLKQVMRKRALRYTENEHFDKVMLLCRNAHIKDGVWLTNEFIHLFSDLFGKGCAYSIEVWDGDDIIGGLFGLRMPSYRSVESMFSIQNDMSKLALRHVCSLERGHRSIIDLQMASRHLLSLGADVISRDEFLYHIKKTP